MAEWASGQLSFFYLLDTFRQGEPREARRSRSRKERGGARLGDDDEKARTALSFSTYSALASSADLPLMPSQAVHLALPTKSTGRAKERREGQPVSPLMGISRTGRSAGRRSRRDRLNLRRPVLRNEKEDVHMPGLAVLQSPTEAGK